MESFSDRLQRLMDLKKKNQREVAAGAGVYQSRVSAWLRGATESPRRDTLQKLSGFFGCNIEWLETGTGDIFPPPPPLGTAENQNFLRKRREQIVDETSAKLSRDRFKMQCLGFFDELFDFVGDCYGENRDAANDFLSEVYKSHANYRLWIEEKKEERRNRDDASRKGKIAENGQE